MDCEFTIDFQGTPAALIDTIKQRILSNNGQFSGDDSAGNFSVQVLAAAIEGAYSIDGNNLNISISKKPFFVSCNALKDYVTQNLTRPL